MDSGEGFTANLEKRQTMKAKKFWLLAVLVVVSSLILGIVAGAQDDRQGAGIPAVGPRGEILEESGELNQSRKGNIHRRDTDSGHKYEWKTVGVFGCYGLPDAHQDPKNPDRYIITWQRYISIPPENQVENVKFTIYNARTRTFSPEKYAFEPCSAAIMQAHPCWGYSHGKYRVFCCQKNDQSAFIAEVTTGNWSVFQRYRISKNETVAMSNLAECPHMVFLPVDKSTAWLFFLNWWNQQADTLFYTIFHADSGWDRIAHPIPTSTLVGHGKHTMGTALKEGSDIVLYSHVGSGENTGNAYRFKTGDRGKTWTVEQLSVSGIAEPFKCNIDGQLFTRVVKKGHTYYLSSQSQASHRWLARSDDGVRFELVADFGKRRSLGNEMVNIEGTRDVLLIYASCIGGDKHIECLVYDTGKE